MLHSWNPLLLKREGVGPFESLSRGYQKLKFKLPLLHFDSSVSQPCKILIQVFIVLKHCMICIFLIDSDSLERMLTALSKLVWNIQKKYMYIFFKYQGKLFRNIKNVLVT